MPNEIMKLKGSMALDTSRLEFLVYLRLCTRDFSLKTINHPCEIKYHYDS